MAIRFEVCEAGGGGSFALFITIATFYHNKMYKGSMRIAGCIENSCAIKVTFIHDGPVRLHWTQRVFIQKTERNK